MDEMLGSQVVLQYMDWIVLLAVAILILVVTIWSAIRTGNPIDYFLGGRRSGKIVMLFFAFGAGTSSDQQGSVFAATWRSGLAGLWWQFIWLPVTPFYWIAAPLLRRVRAITTADFFALRFGPATAVLYSIYGTAISIVLIAGILFSSSHLVVALTGDAANQVAARIQWQVPDIEVNRMFEAPAVDRESFVRWRPVTGVEVVMLGLSLIFAACGALGGLGATILTDVIQGVLLLVFSFVMLPIVFSQIGGFGSLHQNASLKTNMLDFVANSGAIGLPGHEPFTPFYLCMLSLAAVAGIIVQPHIMSLCGAARSELDSRIGFTFGNLLKRALAVVWAFTALAAVAWYLGDQSPLLTSGDPAEIQLYAQLKQSATTAPKLLSEDKLRVARQADLLFADQLYGRVCRQLLPQISAGLMGMFLALILASVVSHCGTQMVVASGLLTECIYRRHIAQDRTPRHYLRIGRLFCLVVVVLAMLLQTTFGDVIDALRVMIKIPAAIGISMWLGLVWTRWNTPAVWVATLASTGMWIVVAYFPEEVLFSFPGARELMFFETDVGLVMRDSWQIFWYLLVGLSCGSVAALLTDPQSADQLDHFYCLLRTRVSRDEKIEDACVLPDVSDEPEPSVTIGSFQLPGPTRLGVAGFAIAFAVVGLIVVGTKWISLII